VTTPAVPMGWHPYQRSYPYSRAWIPGALRQFAPLPCEPASIHDVKQIMLSPDSLVTTPGPTGNRRSYQQQNRISVVDSNASGVCTALDCECSSSPMLTLPQRQNSGVACSTRVSSSRSAVSRLMLLTLNQQRQPHAYGSVVWACRSAFDAVRLRGKNYGRPI